MNLFKLMTVEWRGYNDFLLTMHRMIITLTLFGSYSTKKALKALV